MEPDCSLPRSQQPATTRNYFIKFLIKGRLGRKKKLNVIYNTLISIKLIYIKHISFCEVFSTQKGWKSSNIWEHLLTNQNSIQKEITSRLKSGNACYHSAQNILSSSFLSKNIKIKIYRTMILPVVLCGCETWSLTFRGGRRLRVFWEEGVKGNIWA